MHELSDLELRICLALSPLSAQAKQESWSDPRWTREIKNSLIRLAKEYQDVQVCASTCERAHWSEWLYDMVWLRKDDDGSHILDIPLVVESEWDASLIEILDDFYKLLVARSQHRVMIFGQRNVDLVRKVVVELEDQVSAFRGTQPGDRYLLLGWDSTTRQFNPHLIVK